MSILAPPNAPQPRDLDLEAPSHRRQWHPLGTQHTATGSYSLWQFPLESELQFPPRTKNSFLFSGGSLLPLPLLPCWRSFFQLFLFSFKPHQSSGGCRDCLLLFLLLPLQKPSWHELVVEGVASGGPGSPCTVEPIVQTAIRPFSMTDSLSTTLIGFSYFIRRTNRDIAL